MDNIILDNIPSESAPVEDGIQGGADTEEKIDYEKVLDLALKIGVGLLSSGGSVSRVETAVDRICVAYGAEEVAVSAFPSMIIGSVKSREGHEYTLLKRVYSTSNNLALLEKYNQLSRDICREKFPPSEALELYCALASAKPRNRLVTVFGAGCVGMTYSVFFGGTLADCLPAFFVALTMAAFNELISKRSLNVYATTFLLSVLGGVLSILSCKLLILCGLACHGVNVMIGTIMILIPGLMLTNAVRDLFTGDIMSGSFQIINSLLLTTVIAAGYAVAMIILRPMTDFIAAPVRSGWEQYIYFVASGAIGTCAICAFFNLNVKRLGWAVLAAVLSLGVYIGVELLFPADVFFPVFFAALFGAAISEALARLIKTPATVFLIPSIIALVPGSSLYLTMEALVQGNTSTAAAMGTQCVLILLGLAVGICATTVIYRLISPVKLKYYFKNKFNMLKRSKGGKPGKSGGGKRGNK